MHAAGFYYEEANKDGQSYFRLMREPVQDKWKSTLSKWRQSCPVMELKRMTEHIRRARLIKYGIGAFKMDHQTRLAPINPMPAAQFSDLVNQDYTQPSYSVITPEVDKEALERLREKQRKEKEEQEKKRKLFEEQQERERQEKLRLEKIRLEEERKRIEE